MKTKIDVLNLSIQPNTSILEALKVMDKTYKRLLIVFDKDKFVGLLSVGDIQRAIIAGKNLNEEVQSILRKDVKVASTLDSFDNIKALMLKHRMEFIPVVDDNNKLQKIYFWEDVFAQTEKVNSAELNLPVVIMAGGKGTRLAPLTNVLPKPLIPIGDKTIVEEIMDRFVDAGCSNFFMSVNYKSDMIKYYFSSLENKPYNINYFQEDKPLGTAGSMFLIKDKITSTFFVSNCDIIIDQDLEEIYKYHKDNKNVITIVSALKNYHIPYGTIETKKQGLLHKLIEKPDLVFQINSGMYILEPELLDEIPENEFYHITELIDKVKNSGRNVGVFPVSEKSWRDIGDWDEYLKNIK